MSVQDKKERLSMNYMKMESLQHKICMKEQMFLYLQCIVSQGVLKGMTVLSNKKEQVGHKISQLVTEKDFYERTREHSLHQN